MVCEVKKIESNLTGFSFAEEECLKQLPAQPTFYGIEVNTYPDFGASPTYMARATINPSRQNKKGTITDIEASGGFGADFTKNNLNRLLQGVFFADAREQPTTDSFNAAKIAISDVDADEKEYAATSGLLQFRAGDIVIAENFNQAANNGLKTVASSTSTGVVVVEALADEAAPPADARLTVVGKKFAAGAISVLKVGNLVYLTSTTVDFTQVLKLIPGQWVFLGGDAANSRFNNNVGYGRVHSITATQIELMETSFEGVTEAGAAVALSLFTGDVIRNEKDPALIKRRSYNLERTLGENSNGNTQAEYIEGAIANEFTLNIPQADKLTADLSFVGCDVSYRSGDVGDLVKDGTRVTIEETDAFNTSTDISRIKMSILDETNSNSPALFGYVSEATVTINNNVSGNKAVGVLGNFDASFGNFDVSASITVYFTEVEAIRAIRQNKSVSFNIIAAAANSGFVFDFPLIALSGGQVSVEKDQPITLPLESSAAENIYGHTALYQRFHYLPNVAMPE